MAIVKLSDVNGEKILSCFDTADCVDYITGFEDGTEGLPDFQVEDEEIE